MCRFRTSHVAPIQASRARSRRYRPITGSRVVGPRVSRSAPGIIVQHASACERLNELPHRTIAGAGRLELVVASVGQIDLHEIGRTLALSGGLDSCSLPLI